MARLRQTRKNMHYFLLKIGKKKIRLGVKARNATQQVILTRRLDDVMQGDQGMAITCANAQCALRMDGGAFPHPVYLAEFTDNRAYIVDKLNKTTGVPTHCVVYAHDQGKFQREYDTLPKQRLAKMSGVEKSFILTPPQPYIPKPVRAKETRSQASLKSGKKHKGFSKGAIARAERAGVVLIPPKKEKAA